MPPSRTAPSSSSTNSGMPSERSNTRSTSSRSGRSPRIASICAATSTAPRRSSSRRSSARCCSQRAAMRRNGCARCSSSERTVSTSSSGRMIEPPTSRASRSSVAWSAHCTSSNTSTRGALGGQASDHGDDELEQARRVALARERVGAAVVQLGHQSAQLAARGPQQLVELILAHIRRQRSEHVDHRRQWDPAALELDAPAAQHPRVRARAQLHQLPDQPRLAHAGLAADDDGHPLAGEDARQRLRQSFRFRSPPHQDGADKARRHARIISDAPKTHGLQLPFAGRAARGYAFRRHRIEGGIDVRQDDRVEGDATRAWGPWLRAGCSRTDHGRTAPRPQRGRCSRRVRRRAVRAPSPISTWPARTASGPRATRPPRCGSPWPAACSRTCSARTSRPPTSTRSSTSSPTGSTFADLQQRDMTYSLSSPDPSGMVCQVTSTDRAHGFRLVSDYITDPARTSVVVHTTLQPLGRQRERRVQAQGVRALRRDDRQQRWRRDHQRRRQQRHRRPVQHRPGVLGHHRPDRPVRGPGGRRARRRPSLPRRVKRLRGHPQRRPEPARRCITRWSSDYRSATDGNVVQTALLEHDARPAVHARARLCPGRGRRHRRGPGQRHAALRRAPSPPTRPAGTTTTRRCGARPPGSPASRARRTPPCRARTGSRPTSSRRPRTRPTSARSWPRRRTRGASRCRRRRPMRAGPTARCSRATAMRRSPACSPTATAPPPGTWSCSCSTRPSSPTAASPVTPSSTAPWPPTRSGSRRSTRSPTRC